MQLYDDFMRFWRDHFSAEKQSQRNFDAWTIAHITHTDDRAYQQLAQAGQDPLGYQPTLFSLADPLKQTSKEVMVKYLGDSNYSHIRQQYRQRFLDQMPNRFGLFYSDKTQADAIYDSWDVFAAEWLERGGQSLLSHNLPLLFDHVSDMEYWAWKHKNFDPCGTQRLIVTIFQYRTGRFADIFITNVDDAEMTRITMLIQSKITLQSQDIF